MSYTSYQAGYPSGYENNDYTNIFEDDLDVLKADLATARDNVNASFINTFGFDSKGYPTGFLVDRADANNKFIYYDFKPFFQKIPMIATTVYNKYDDGLAFTTQMTLQNLDYALHPDDFPDYCVVSQLAGFYSFPIDTSA